MTENPSARKGIPKEDMLNRRALRGILGWSDTAERDLAELLRSDSPIHWQVRDALADAFDGKASFGRHATLIGGGEQSKRARKYQKLLRQLEAARSFAENRHAGMSYSDALRAAANQYGYSASTCEKANKLAAEMDAWVSATQMAGPSCRGDTTRDFEMMYLSYRSAGCTPPLDGAQP